MRNSVEKEGCFQLVCVCVRACVRVRAHVEKQFKVSSFLFPIINLKTISVSPCCSNKQYWTACTTKKSFIYC